MWCTVPFIRGINVLEYHVLSPWLLALDFVLFQAHGALVNPERIGGAAQPVACSHAYIHYITHEYKWLMC